MTNIKLLSLSVLTALISFSATAEDTATNEGKKTYKAACFVCHDAGVANAPKLGDKVAWAPRIALGIEALYNTSLKGKGAMPPKGGRPDLSDDAVKAAVDYMVSKASDETAEPKKEETKEAPKEEPKKDDTPKTEETK
jgi:cytochrome c5